MYHQKLKEKTRTKIKLFNCIISYEIIIIKSMWPFDWLIYSAAAIGLNFFILIISFLLASLIKSVLFNFQLVSEMQSKTSM